MQYSPARAAKIAEVDRSTITRALLDGTLPGHKRNDNGHWSIESHDLELWMERHVRRAAAPEPEPAPEPREASPAELEELEAAKARVGHLERLIDEAILQVRERDQKIIETLAELGDAKSDKGRLEGLVEGLGGQLETIKEGHSAAIQERDEARALSAKLEAKAAMAAGLLEGTQSELERASADLERERAELSKERADLKKVRQELAAERAKGFWKRLFG